MDFLVGFPQNRYHYDWIWVIVDLMTKLTHLIIVNVPKKMEDYTFSKSERL